MKIKIKLLSDMCSANGRSYNSYVDTDICYDELGLPYIPAKRIKGCLREAALELMDWDVISTDTYGDIFGKEGIQEGKLSISDAFIENYDEMTEDILSYNASVSDSEEKSGTNPNLDLEYRITPLEVLECYSYIRTQTKLDNAGIAEETSLRTIRVLRKDTVLEADFELEEEYLQDFKKIAEAVCHMGLNRTRGLGLVSLTIDESNKKIQEKMPDKTFNTAYEENDRFKISYKIYLKSSMLVQSVELNAGNYIEGSKVLGLLANGLMDKQIDLQDIIVSNAYISDGSTRNTPVAKSLVKKKDTVFENNKLEVYNLIGNGEINFQTSPIGDMYINDRGEVMSVKQVMNYHHRRPEDKSIGRATGSGASSFYQLKAIEKGQCFMGYIMASGKDVQKIIDTISELKNVRMGYSRNTEYGEVEFSVENIQKLETKINSQKDFSIKLNSPMILYNEYGVATTDTEELGKVLAKLLHTDEKLIGVKQDGKNKCNAYIAYTDIGGFNTTWHKRKPIMKVLDKGSAYSFSLDKQVDIGILDAVHIGERVSEGYGEIEVVEYKDKFEVTKSVKRKNSMDESLDDKEIIKKVMLQRHIEKAKAQAVNDAKAAFDERKDIQNNVAAISKLILIKKTATTFEELKKQAEAIMDNNGGEDTNGKKSAMQGILAGVSDEEAADETPHKIYDSYITTYLNQIKYLIRTKNSKGE